MLNIENENTEMKKYEQSFLASLDQLISNRNDFIDIVKASYPKFGRGEILFQKLLTAINKTCFNWFQDWDKVLSQNQLFESLQSTENFDLLDCSISSHFATMM